MPRHLATRTRHERPAAIVVVVAVLLGLLVVLAEPASSAGGTLDTTFGASGIARLDVGGTGSTDALEDLALQSDGMVVGVGRTSTGMAMLRLKTDGTLDSAFGTAGSVGATTLDPARAVAVQPDGKIVVVGQSAPTGGNLVLARYSAAGQLDPGFGTSGTVTVTMSGAGSGGWDVAVQSDGMIDVLAVDAGVLTVLRFTSAGAADSTFGTSGRANQTATPSGGNRLALQADGKIVLTGLSGTAGGLVRLKADGTADTGFGTSGTATTANHVPRAVAAPSGGKLVVAGDLGASDTKVMVSRRNADGTLDSTFGASGVATFAVTGLADPSARAVAVQSDGSIVVVGRNDDTARTSAVFVARLTSAGVLDTGFATGGVATFSTVATFTTAAATAVAVDGSGRFVVGGSVNNDHASFTNDDDLAVFRVVGTSTTSTTSSTAPVTATAGQTVSTDPDGSTPTTSNRILVSVTTPVAGSVGITKTTSSTVTNFRFLAGATITAPTASVANPLKLVFSVDVSTLPSGLPATGVTVLRDGTAASDCTSTTTAAPDPCVLSRSKSGSALTITVLTSKASTWTLGRPVVERIFGDDRIQSAIAVSEASFAKGGAAAVVLSRSDDFADALAAIPLAAKAKGPLLLTDPSTLDDRVLAELTRVLPAGKTVYVLGGADALEATVATRIERWGYVVNRLWGATRSDTAVAVAAALGTPQTVIETTGLDFADALAAGAAAASVDGAVLLTAGSRQSAATAGYLAPGMTRYAIGGPAAAADPDATKVVGVDRYETAVLVAKRFFGSGVATIGVASGASFADALAGGAHAAASHAPLLLLPPSGAIPVPVSIFLRDQSSPPSAYVYGGTAALDDDVAGALRTALGG